MTPSLWIIIPAAGVGSRFGSDFPKQYHTLLDKTVLEQTISRFAGRPNVKGMVIAVSPDDQRVKELALPAGVRLVEGGKERVDSVYAALQSIAGQALDTDLVAVHDAARPCVPGTLLDALFAEAGHAAAGVLPVLPVCETVKQVEQNAVAATMDRSHIFLAQTPQVFPFSLLSRALAYVAENGLAVTDDASAVEALGLRPQVVEGDSRNIKITTAGDLPLAGFFLQQILDEEQPCA